MMMASPRLLKQDKLDIVKAVLENASKERMEHLKDREAQVARAVYLHLVKGYGKYIQAVPAGYFTEDNDVGVKLYKNARDLKAQKNSIPYHRVTLGDDYRTGFAQSMMGKYSYSSDSLEFGGETVRMPECYQYDGAHLLLSSPLGQEVKALIDEQQKLHDDLTALGDTVRKAVSSCTTVKKLIENYPELKEYAPSDIANTSMAVAHGKIESLIECTKKSTCEDKPAKKEKKPDVIAL